MKQLAVDLDFTHVVIARHRPQSNGITERFVRTLKEWLAGKSWESTQELRVLLNHFRPEYNDRPHQGLPISGLSPNEFADRIGRLSDARRLNMSLTITRFRISTSHFAFWALRNGRRFQIPQSSCLEVHYEYGMGIPRGRILPLDFGMCVLLIGEGGFRTSTFSSSCLLNLSASSLSEGVARPSTPAVCFPVFARVTSLLRLS